MKEVIEKNYPVTLPFKDLGSLQVFITPSKIYGDKLGIELIEKFASKTDREEAKKEKLRKYKRDWWNKESLTGVTNKDRRTLTRVGSELNDFSFNQHLKKLNTLTGKEREKYINSLKSLPDDEFTSTNEAKMSKYRKVIVKVAEELEEDILNEE
jgi:hypothetical protein